MDFEDVKIGDIIRNGNYQELIGKNFQWRDNEHNLAIPDCPFILGAIPVMKTAKIESIINNLNPHRVTFKIGGQDYSLLMPELVEKNVLDCNLSSIRYFRSGRIMSIEAFVFKKDALFPPFFRITEYPLVTFVTDNIAEHLMQSELNNLKLVKCKFS